MDRAQEDRITDSPGRISKQRAIRRSNERAGI